MQTPYYTYKSYIKQHYGHALYSIPIDLDLGCPNRTPDGSGGCTFCPQNGARAAQTLDANSIEEQMKSGIQFAQKRYKAQHFMLYIQAYTGTFTSVINQKKTYSKLLKLYAFDAISIGTRPDCLSSATLKYLQELNEELDVCVDLGVQTLNNTTLQTINRGHDAQCSITAIKQLKAHGIKVFAHIIVGLKGETRKDWSHTVKSLCDLDVDGIKIHNLHIIKNTQLCQEYQKEPFKVYNEYEYANEVIHLLRHIPSHIPIIRINTDTPTQDLEAPLWHMQKGQFNEYVQERMLLGDIRQGDAVETLQNIAPFKQNQFKLKDGSITLWENHYKDYYHPKSGAFLQARELFIKVSNLKERLQKSPVKLLDIGFGMGYNSLEAIKIPSHHSLHITALDKNRNVIQQSALLQEGQNQLILQELYHTSAHQTALYCIELIIDEIRYSLSQLNTTFDVIFLDAFMHTVNPSLITTESIQQIKALLKQDGVLVCSQNIDTLKSALSLNGFEYEIYDIEKTDVKGLKATLGTPNEVTTLPYEDLYLVYREKQIITLREQKLAKER